jgi:hypothetical protein
LVTTPTNRMLYRGAVHCLAALLMALTAAGQTIVSETARSGAFPLVSAMGAATIVVDDADDALVRKAASLLQQDIEMVSGQKPDITNSLPKKNMVLVGSLQSAFIQQLVKAGKLNAGKLKGQWEGYQLQIIKSPFAGVEQALVITGSDRRGTAYGVFELSKQMGVSPWWWWADVPVKKKKEVHVHLTTSLTDAPRVKYRGIFINDEAPALSTWSREKFGGFNHRFYEKVFELMLRLKANYLWPAMWGNAFYDDDSLNIRMADTYGIVIGTSHHEPLMRAHDEWRRHGSGKWNYDSNAVRLQAFWRQGMQRATNEKIVSVGMRGDGDEPMSRETATALLERIVADQRKIISEVTGKPAGETPQLWALYKEVQDYYDKGMRVPDDVTLLLCDDNWGNIRKLPRPDEPKRKGGYGIYYHFDYVGGPRNYKWLNTNNLARVWEQMDLAYAHGVDQIWIVNVGDIKPMELPISFFLDHAWNPAQWNAGNLMNYYTQWAGQQFGQSHAAAIGEVLRNYALYSARRKPELLDANTYTISPLARDNEFRRVVLQWDTLYNKAERISAALPAEQQAAFFQLVLHPVKALRNLHLMYEAAAWNKWHAAQNHSQANEQARLVERYYKEDSMITVAYHSLNNGKWNGMMSQTHIGYTIWQQPPVNKMPAVKLVTNGQDPTPVEAVRLRSAKDSIAAGSKGNLFYEEQGVVSMLAHHYTKAVNGQSMQWKIIPDIGREGAGITTFPPTASARLSATSPHADFTFYNYSNDSAVVHLYFSPTLNFYNAAEGLQFAVSIDDAAPQLFSLNKEDKNSISGIWNKWVAENIIIKRSSHGILKPGKHTLKYWAVSPGVVLQKAVVDFGGLKPSYLGPPENKN